MTAVDTAPPLRLDRYLALLAILMALVLGLLVIGERQKAGPLLPTVEGAVPAVPGAAAAGLLPGADRGALLAEQEELAARLRQTEAALRRAEAEIERLRAENRTLTDRLQGEGAALDELARRLAAVEAERDRLAGELAALEASRERVETELADPSTSAPRPPAAGVAPATPPASRNPSAAVAAQPRGLQAALEEMIREQRAAQESAGAADPGTSAAGTVDPTSGAVAASEPGRLITFNGSGGTVADGIRAYRAGDYGTAERIWGALAATGDPRAQFHFGASMYEGRTGAPDLVMAYVWLSRAVDGGHLPAIELRRQVRAAMSEAQFQQALAIQTSS